MSELREAPTRGSWVNTKVKIENGTLTIAVPAGATIDRVVVKRIEPTATAEGGNLCTLKDTIAQK